MIFFRAGRSFRKLDVTKAVHKNNYPDLTTPRGLVMRPDGSGFVYFNKSGDRLSRYDMSEPWKVATSSDANDMIDVDDGAASFTMRLDGRRLFLLSTTNGAKVHQYHLQSPWDISCASQVNKSHRVDSQDDFPNDIEFGNSGSVMFVLGKDTDTIYQYDLGCPWDISTAQYANKSLDVSSQENLPVGFSFSHYGHSLVLVGEGAVIYQYDLSVPWDISTATYTSKSLEVSAHIASPKGILLTAEDIRLYVLGTGILACIRTGINR